MAVRIDRVEREFILKTAAEAKTPARLRAPGRSVKCKVITLNGSSVDFSVEGELSSFANRERVSVCFDFRGQAVAFDAPVLKSAAGLLELGLPEFMYRSLSRRWPRVAPPKDLSVEFLLPDAQLILDCPESETWADVELPELREGLDSSSLSALVESFKSKASLIASEGRVIMYKDRGPADIAEEMASKLGRILFAPTTLGPLPQSDPYPMGRIVTRMMAEDFEGIAAAAQGSRLAAYLQSRAVEGLVSCLWCPVVYFSYTVGIVYMANDRGRSMSLDYQAVDLAWEFSRILAWFLKRHGYFAGADQASGPRKGGIIDASPSGLLAALSGDAQSLEQDAVIRLRLSLKGKTVICSGKVARKYREGDMNYCGIAFIGLSAQDLAAISLGLYGEDEQSSNAGA